MLVARTCFMPWYFQEANNSPHTIAVKNKTLKKKNLENWKILHFDHMVTEQINQETQECSYHQMFLQNWAVPGLQILKVLYNYPVDTFVETTCRRGNEPFLRQYDLPFN